MRLQLILTAWALSTANAFAGGSVSTRVDVYSDEMIDVVIPAVEAAYEGERIGVKASYGADILSGATPVLTADTISSATTYSETRHSGSAGVTLMPTETWNVGGTYRISVEPDYRTHAAGVNISLDLFKRMSTLDVGFSYSLEAVGKSTDASYRKSTATRQLDLGWSQILTRRTLLRALVTGGYSTCAETLGCQANPYRYVAILSDDDDLSMVLSERTPSSLLRLTAALRLSQAIGNSTAIHGEYRFYVDSWSVLGHTAGLTLAQSFLSERLVFEFESRASTHSGVDFYRDSYTYNGDSDPPTYRTADREFSGLRSLRLGLRAEGSLFSVGPFSQLSMNGQVARTWYRYPSFSEFPTRNAWLIGGGFDATF